MCFLLVEADILMRELLPSFRIPIAAQYICHSFLKLKQYHQVGTDRCAYLLRKQIKQKIEKNSFFFFLEFLTQSKKKWFFPLTDVNNVRST